MEQTATEQLRSFKVEQTGKSAEERKAAFASQEFRDLARRAAAYPSERREAEEKAVADSFSHCFSHCFSHHVAQ